MRDLLLSLVVAGLLPVALVRPVAGAYLWAWLSIMNPHQLAYGFARSVPWAMLAALVTLVGFLFTRDKRALPNNGGTVLLGMLIVWFCVTSYFSINDPDAVWERWTFAMKILLMLVVTLMLLRGRRQIDLLIIVIVFSVGFFGFKGGIWTIITGGSSRVWGPPGGMLQGNNELAVALVTQLPWMYYLMHAVARRRWVKYFAILSMVLCTLAILGTQSRGALLALLAMAWLLGLKGKYPVRTTFGLAALLAAAIVFMPSSWTDRMETIQTYEEDSSAMSRIHTWKTLWNVAIDRPLVGAGFRADNPALYQKYASEESAAALGGMAYVAHSIYFQALGEHGFVGLFLYCGLGVWIWWKAGRLARATENDAEFGQWVPLLMKMTQVSIVGFAVGGAFLSLMLLDLPYYILGVVILTDATVNESRRSAIAVAVPRPPRVSA